MSLNFKKRLVGPQELAQATAQLKELPEHVSPQEIMLHLACCCANELVEDMAYLPNIIMPLFKPEARKSKG